MSAWLLEPAYWNWWLIGVVFMAIEAIVPGFFFLWMGVAALLLEFFKFFPIKANRIIFVNKQILEGFNDQILFFFHIAQKLAEKKNQQKKNQKGKAK